MGYKKMVSVLLAVFMICTGLFPGVRAAEHAGSELERHWAKEAVERWVGDGLIQGYSDGAFRPDSPITRAETVALINRGAGFSERALIVFSDVHTTDWFAQDVAVATAAGYINGYEDGTMKPNASITRQELAVIVARIADLQENSAAAEVFIDAIPAWSKGSIGAVREAGWMDGYPDGTFGAERPITRAEAVVTLDRFLQQRSSSPVTPAVIYDRAGHYGSEQERTVIAGNVEIRSSDVTLHNMSIAGNLTISAGVGEGSVFLKNVEVAGTTSIYGGGENSIHLDDTALKEMVVNKDGGRVRIAASGSTAVSKTNVQSGVILEEEDDAVGDGFSDVIIASEVPEGAAVTLRGDFGRVRLQAAGINVKLEAGSIQRIEVGSEADGSTVRLERETEVHQADIYGKASFRGQGTIRSAYLAVAGVQFDKQPDRLTCATGIVCGIGGGDSDSSDSSDSDSPPSREPLQIAGVSADIDHGTVNVTLNQPVLGVREQANGEAPAEGAFIAPQVRIADEDWYDIGIWPQGADVADGLPLTAIRKSDDASTEFQLMYHPEAVIARNYAVKIYTRDSGGSGIRIVATSSPFVLAEKDDSEEPPLAVTGLDYEPQAIRLEALEQTQQVTLTARWSDGTTSDVTGEAAWHSADDRVAVVNGGLVTAKGEGSTMVSAEYSGHTVNIPVTVTIEQPQPQPTVTGLVYEPQTIRLEALEQTQRVTLIARWSDGTTSDVTGQAAWHSADDRVATVNGGLVTAKGEGSTVVRAEYSGHTVNIPVTVTVERPQPQPTVTGLVYDPQAIRLEGLEQTQQVTLTARWSDGTTSDVTGEAAWRSADDNVAAVNSGLVTAKGEGSTVVRAEYSGYAVDIPVAVVLSAYGVNAAIETGTPIAGAANKATLTVVTSEGLTDAGFNGRYDVKVSGFTQAASGTYGRFAGQEITGAALTTPLQFTSGQAEAELIVHHASTQPLTFSISGIGPTASITIVPTFAAAEQLTIHRQPSVSVLNGTAFEQQPVVHVVDRYHNIVTDSDALISAEMAQPSTGSTVLFGTTAVRAASGVVEFTDLGLRGYDNTARIAFTAAGLAGAVSDSIDIANGFAGGSGTADDPYVIETAEQLNEVRNHLSAHFVLNADIDLGAAPYNAGAGWEPIGTFTGTLDGNGHTIRNLTVRRGNSPDAGLFGRIGSPATIRNITLQNASVEGATNTGILAGYMAGGTIENVQADGRVNSSSYYYTGGLVGRTLSGTIIRSSQANAEISGMWYVGGLVGTNEGDIEKSHAAGKVFSNALGLGGLTGANFGSITDSYASTSVEGGSNDVGGLVGANSGAVRQSYAKGTISTNAQHAGGLAGKNTGTIANAYSQTSMTVGGSAIGGLVGDNTGMVTHSYAAGTITIETFPGQPVPAAGGLIGTNGGEGAIINSYYDRDVTQVNDTGKGEPRTTAQMKQQATFAGWDFANIWSIQGGQAYPALRWE